MKWKTDIDPRTVEVLTGEIRHYPNKELFISRFVSSVIWDIPDGPNISDLSDRKEIIRQIWDAWHRNFVDLSSELSMQPHELADMLGISSKSYKLLMQAARLPKNILNTSDRHFPYPMQSYVFFLQSVIGIIPKIKKLPRTEEEENKTREFCIRYKREKTIMDSRHDYTRWQKIIKS